MKLGSMRGSALVLVLALFVGGVAPASATEPAAVPTGGPDRAHFTVGEELAKTVTVVTGVPISPLLGVSALGAFRWFRTAEPQRAALPWYAQPWFWGSGLALVFLFFANTTIGGLIPGLKKPMDFVEEHENKLSALLATPIVLLQGQRLLPASGLLAALPAAGGAGAPLSSAGLASLAGLDRMEEPIRAGGCAQPRALSAADDRQPHRHRRQRCDPQLWPRHGS